MNSFYIILLLIGILIAGAGIYYLTQEKDPEFRKIYTVTLVAGLVVLAFSIFKLFF